MLSFYQKLLRMNEAEKRPPVKCSAAIEAQVLKSRLRWNPILLHPAHPPYKPARGARVLLRMRTGTIDQFDSALCEVTSVRECPERFWVCLGLKAQERGYTAVWNGTEWRIAGGPFFYEVDLTPC